MQCCSCFGHTAIYPKTLQHNNYNCIMGFGLQKQTSAILEFYFWFRLYHCIGQVTLHQDVEFHRNRTIFSRVTML